MSIGFTQISDYLIVYSFSSPRGLSIYVSVTKAMVKAVIGDLKVWVRRPFKYLVLWVGVI